MIKLDGLGMYVSSTAADGVVDSDTRLHFIQKGERVAARYSGGMGFEVTQRCVAPANLPSSRASTHDIATSYCYSKQRRRARGDVR